MFGYAREKRVDVVFAKMLRKMVGEGNQLTEVSPVEDNLIPHIYCVNHCVAMYKRASEPIYWTPNPWKENQGWMKNDMVFWNRRGPCSQFYHNLLWIFWRQLQIIWRREGKICFQPITLC